VEEAKNNDFFLSYAGIKLRKVRSHVQITVRIFTIFGEQFFMKLTALRFCLGLATIFYAGNALAADPAFKVFGTSVSMDEVAKEKQGDFYEIEKKKYELIESMAYEKFLEKYWEKKASDQKSTVAEARRVYMEKNTKISDSEVKQMVEKYKDNPQFAKFSKDEQQKQVREFLRDRASRNLEMDIIKQGRKSGDLVIAFPEPKEPVFAISLTDADQTRYGPGIDDIKPIVCDKKSCPITIVEYSEFQCPFCSKAMPAVKKILTEYRGKISWTVRDFPLSFHDRARPAAVAAHCAGDQGKYWGMYQAMFDNQTELQDEHLKKYALKLVPNKAKWEECFKNASAKYPIIDANMESGMKVGVTGTPAFFINGRRLSGALPYEEFKRVIDEELSRRKKS
jgi:protein-disulfide isomerase